PSQNIGDLSTVLGPLAEAPRISFNPDGVSMSYSDDVTTIVQQMVSGALENWGFMTDSWNCGSNDYFGTSGNPSPKFRARVGVMTQFASNPDVRPRLIIEYDDAGTTNTSPTPTPVPTATATPTVTPTPTPTPDPFGDGRPLTLLTPNGGETLIKGQ